VFDFSAAPRIVFGSSALTKVPEFVANFGRRVLMVTGSRPERYASVAAALGGMGATVEVFRVLNEPKAEDIALGVSLARTFGANVVLGIGGGSVLDAAKAIAAVTTNPGELLDYLEVVGRGQALNAPGLPCVAVPTTSGTGAEVTRNAVIDVPAQSTKVSLRGPYVMPRIAVVDPDLTLSVSPELSAATGFDALTQVIEPYLSRRHNPVTDGIAQVAIARAASALPRVVEDGTDRNAREQMAWVSLMGGLCLTQAGLGAVHGLAGPLGGVLKAPHGALCAALLAPTLASNLAALRASTLVERDEQLTRYRRLGQLLLERADATEDDGIAFLFDLSARLEVPKLKSFGLKESEFDGVIERAVRASRMQYNAVTLTTAELAGILRAAL
jgi:alcohol dehydrogenase class IV